jgi:hypothetical protein
VKREDAMVQAIAKSRSRKVNGYVKAVLALEAARQRRDELAAEVAARTRALSGGQHAEAQRILGAMTGPTPTSDRGSTLVVARPRPGGCS